MRKNKGFFGGYRFVGISSQTFKLQTNNLLLPWRQNFRPKKFNENKEIKDKILRTNNQQLAKCF